jgi:beta-lactamase class A
MLADIKLLLLGELFSQSPRNNRRIGYSKNKTRGPRLRARLDKNWRAAGTTGSDEREATNDVGPIEPPNRHPAIVSIYLTGSSGNASASRGSGQATEMI